ncbi:HD-GYP domain-containing protein [Paenibacillus sp. KS-LC4]|uniref:HD-GYP domain-containing protein n=1 Tax=Paenibacillus sp. KS-LC4 TaxID=2979727 RepID=UPI0030D12712
MPTVTLSQVKLGDKISEDVLTPLGRVLLQKGKVIAGRELEILRAFIISNVTVDGPAVPAKAPEDAKAGAASKQVDDKPFAASSLHDEYDKMLVLLKQVFNDHAAPQGIPIMDIRNQMENLLQHIKNYQILTFVPRSFMERDYLLHNSIACALTSYLIAQWNGFPQKEWMQVALGGLLHDFGNTRIDRSILSKPTSLTVEELEEMKRHTVLGYQMLKNVASLNDGAKLAALQHHERVDGTGYPLGIDAAKIHPYGKIVAIADIFHAMTLNKSYRKGVSPYLVLEQIQSDAFGKLDPTYVRVFVEKVTQFHNGTKVRLSDERVGEIVFSDHVHPTRPWVSIEGSIINLTVERHLHINEVIPS